MKVKTSITLSPDTLRGIDEVVAGGSRSEFIEAAVVDCLARRRRAERDARDVVVLDRIASELDPEILDSLEWQAEP